jgi:hypothetical protein
MQAVLLKSKNRKQFAKKVSKVPSQISIEDSEDELRTFENSQEYFEDADDVK